MNGIKPKLLIFINTLQSGGAERVVSLLLEHLRNDFEIHLALYSNIIDYKIPAEIKLLDLHQPLRQSRLVRLFKIPFLSHKVYKYCAGNQINISVAFLYRPCYINALMKSWWGYKGKVIMCERTHQTTMQQSQSRLYRMFSKFMVRFSYKRADLVLADLGLDAANALRKICDQEIVFVVLADLPDVRAGEDAHADVARCAIGRGGRGSTLRAARTCAGSHLCRRGRGIG